MGQLSFKRLWVLMATAFIDMVGFALVLPLLPLYAKDFGASATTIGFLLASFAAAQLLTAPLWGRLSDRVGRRPVIVAGQVMNAIAFLLFAASHSVWLLLLSRLAQGAGGGTIAANQAYIADAVQPAQRAKALGWLTAATSAGVMLGPALGSASLVWTESTAAPGLIAAVLCFLNIFFAWRWLPESTSDASRSASRESRRPLRRAFTEVVRYPTVPVHALIWIHASGMLAFTVAISVFSLYLSDRFGVTKETIGGFYAITGLYSVVMRGFLLGPLIRRFGEVRVLKLGIASLALGMMAIPVATTSWAFLLVFLLIPVGTALLFPSTTSLISRFAPVGEGGQIHGVQQAFGSSSRLLGPIVAGFVYQFHEPGPGTVFGGAGPFWLSAVIVALTAFLALKLRDEEHAPTEVVPVRV
jgi:multidrug resistance protein